MRSNQLIISAARDLYFKYRGQNHRQIERDMRGLGCLSFTRRVFYNQQLRDGRTRLGWIEKYEWKRELAGSEPPVPLLPEEGCRRFGDGVVGAAGGMAPESTQCAAASPPFSGSQLPTAPPP